MSFNVNISHECSAVLRFANYFVAIHVSPGRTQFLSNPEDMLTAMLAAKIFAGQRGITFHPDLLDLKTPIYSVIKHDKKWYPIEFYSDKSFLVTSLGEAALGFATKEQAMGVTKGIAAAKKFDFLPQIGISISEKEES